MADGIPIAGKLGDGGVLPTDLDVCGGHVDATYPFYHYHGSDSNPYTVRCLRGCIPNGTAGFMSLSSSAGNCTLAATQYDYANMMNEVNWVDSTFESTVPPSDPTPSPTPKPSPKPSTPSPDPSDSFPKPSPRPSPSKPRGKKNNGKQGRRSLRQ